MNICKRVVIICLLPVFLLLTGCKQLVTGGSEITKLTFPRVTAIDKSSGSNEEVKLTIAALSGAHSSQQSGKGQSGGGQKSGSDSNIIQTAGRTVFEANRVIAAFSNKDIHWGQNEYIIIGEDAAKDDLIKYLDFFIRNHENRFTVSVVVAKGAQGCDVIYAMKDEDGGVAEKLEELFNSASSLALARRIRLSELFNTLNSKNTASILPAISIENEPGTSDEKNINKESGGSGSSGSSGGSGSSQSSGSGKTLAMNGFAVFYDTQLFGYVENDMAMGYNLLENEANSTVLVVKDKFEKNISLEIISSNAECKIKFEDGVPSIKIKVTVDSNISEMSGTDDVFNKEDLDFLEKQVADIIKDDIESAIGYAQKNNLDFFGFNEKVYRKAPVKYENIRDKWHEIFPTMKIDVEVDSIINRTYNIKKPIRNWEADYK